MSEAAPLLRHVPEGAALSDPGAILDRFLAWVASTGLDPYPAQEEALLELMDGKHVVLQTPTGSIRACTAVTANRNAAPMSIGALREIFTAGLPSERWAGARPR